MRVIYFFLLTTILLITVSCTQDDPAADKGRLETATYDATSQTFTLTYQSGYTITVQAVVDNSVTPPAASATLDDGTIVSVSDANVSGDATVTTPDVVSDNQYVNGWIYDQMSIYYLWNDKLSRSPDYSLYPADFFDSILYKYNEVTAPDGDRFSWIQEDYAELLNDLRGVSSDEIGFEYVFAWADQAQTYFYALVLYPKHGTDAEAKGISRGRFVTKIDGQDITPQNYESLFGGTGTKTLSMADWVYYPEESTYYLQDSGEVTIQMHHNYAENPVYEDSVYIINDQKIGYLVYHFFSPDQGDSSYDYDQQLMNRLDAMKTQGVNEMVLDLRYNSGGAVSSAIALASALVKDRSTGNVFTLSEYNDIIHTELLKEFGENYNKDYFIDKVYDTEISIPAMNLPRLYVLTSGWTASASELVINGLKPYMDVFLIGETTYGKNVGSISIYEENDPRNKWGMQPIVVKYFNREGKSDFTAGFTPDYQIDEFAELFLYDFGDTNDPLLGSAIELITGVPTTSATRALRPSTPFRSSRVDKKATLHMQERDRFDMHDDVRGDDIKKLMKK